MLEINKIYLGDCLDLMREIPSKSIDLVLTDIPYNEVNRESNGLRNLNYGKADSSEISLEKICEEIDRVCNGSIYIFCGIEQISFIRRFFRMNNYSTRLCQWEKTNPSVMNGKHIWLSSTENCVYAKRGGAVFNEFCKSPVWKFSLVNNVIHPTQKSLKLFEYLIQTSSKKNTLILDPFSGSGTTAIACHNLNRNFICIEKDPEYHRKSVERYEKHILQLKLIK